ncbi:MAG: FHA domain-containing serine/threonine-protein kinase, partial [Anaerolineales bacterium]
HVTLKVLKTPMSADPSLRVRFQHEARQVARLDHPNIVPVHDFAELNGTLYVVMKFVEGETLKRRLSQGSISVTECARMVGGVAAALQHAHERGVIHCDLKPSNILLATDGSVFLTDFGVARLATIDLGQGSPAYMSPEQASDTPDLDGRSDQYALGVILFEALTGVRPFAAEDARGLMQQHLRAAPPRPGALNPRLSAMVDEVVLRALAKDPAQRFPSISSMAVAFQRAAAPPRPPTAPLRRSGNLDDLGLPAELLPPPMPARASPTGGAASSATVMLMMPGGQIFQLTGKTLYILGRSDPGKDFLPDVDLAKWQGMELGVSRRHGQLHFDKDRLFYTDLKSANGSRINGAGLYAEIPVALDDGDEICLGKMAFRVYYGP